MKRIFLLIIIALVFVACETRYDIVFRHVCNCEQKEKVLEFISDNLEAANNKSDEEMEDVIQELRATAILLTCEQRQFKKTFGGTIIIEEKLDSCESIMRWWD